MGIGSIERKYIIDIYKDAINHMMKITDSRGKPNPTTTTLNNIPVGQVFKGTILYPVAGPVTGIFYKAHGPWSQQSMGLRHDCIVISLDDSMSTGGRFANLTLECRVVENYEPLNVELVIK